MKNENFINDANIDEALIQMIANKYKHLSEQDIRDGMFIMNALGIMDEDSKRAMKVYSGCLNDVAMFRNSKQSA